MRVVAGTYKGRALKVPKATEIRPTSDRVRESLFEMLGPIDDMATLDLFAGSGALGIEASSRGAEPITFVDSDRGAIRVVEENLRQLGVSRARTFRANALSFLRGAARHQNRWDLVFLDPPYNIADRLAGDLQELLMPVIGTGARIACEGSAKHPLRLDLPVLIERRYGKTLIVIYENRDPDAT